MPQHEMIAPTKDRPLLVGLLVDVSGSMTTSIDNTSGESLNRLQSFEKSLGEFAAKARNMSRGKGEGLVSVFAYGFGFGNPLAMFLRGGGPKVRDLLVKSGEISSTISLDYLAEKWSDYQAHVKNMALEMFGDTPMGEGFQTVNRRFREERQKRIYLDNPILFILSDGEPTDTTSEQIARQAGELTKEGIICISCYVTNKDIAQPRHLYGDPHPDWPEGARLMFECASILPPKSPFESYMRENGWKIENEARLFTQINQSEILTEFLNVILSPIDNPAALLTSQPLSQPQKPKRSKVFISYSHVDSEWLDRLRIHLKPLERRGIVDNWDDTRIRSGARWREEIANAISTAKVALLLISANFLASDFIQDDELPHLLKAAEEEGAVIIPIILSPSLFSQTESLAQFQSVNPPSQPLTSLSRNDQERFLVKVALDVESVLSPSAPQPNRAEADASVSSDMASTGSTEKTQNRGTKGIKKTWWKFW